MVRAWILLAVFGWQSAQGPTEAELQRRRESLAQPLLEISWPDGKKHYQRFSLRGYLVEQRWRKEEPDLPSLLIRYAEIAEGMALRLIRFEPTYDYQMSDGDVAAAEQFPITELDLALSGPAVAAPALVEHGLPDLAFRLLPGLSEEMSPLEIYCDLESVAISAVEETQDRFVLTLSNLRPQGVVALYYNASYHMASSGRAIVGAGGEGDTMVSKRAVESANRREGLAPFTIVLRTVVFDDFTFEGEFLSAARFVARERGYQLRLRAELELLEELFSAPLADPGPLTRETLEEIRGHRDALPEAPPEIEADALIERLGRHHPEAPAAVRRGLVTGWRSAGSSLEMEMFKSATTTFERGGLVKAIVRLQLRKFRERLQRLDEHLGPPLAPDGRSGPNP